MTYPVVGTRGVSGGVVAAALATAVGAVPALAGLSAPTVPTGALYCLGWSAFGIAAALLLDRDPRSRLGWAFVALALLPVPVAVAAAATAAGRPVWPRVEGIWVWLGVAPVVAALAVIAWSVDKASDRMSRRRLVWLVTWSGVLVAAVLAGSAAGPRVAAAVTTLGLWGMAALACRLVTLRELRPVGEPLLDAAAGLVTLLFAAAVGVLVGAGGRKVGVPGADLFAVCAAVAAAALVLPGALRTRRLFLDRRYGPGALSGADVERLTADLHAQADPRELLGRAAAMVAAASRNRRVDLVLGPEVPERPGHWVCYPLVIGPDRVGALLLEPRHPEGPEPRQERVVRQLLPTVALVAKAVSLAVEAEHARRDVARERDAERARILGDLHDGLGPMLVGMSMRVRAELRHRPTALLETLATGLADCRSDLRRVVSGLTPSGLHDGNLGAALGRLVGSFEGQGPAVHLAGCVEDDLSPEVAVAVYRSVAEGVANAVRHAHATTVSVDVRTTGAGRVLAQVSDDGGGGPITPGVGLSSLRRRAEELGGTLRVVAGRESGTRLLLDLPTRGTST